MIIKWHLISRLADLAENELYLRWRVGATREGEQTRQAGINPQPFLEFPPGRHCRESGEVLLGEFTSSESLLIHLEFDVYD